MSLTQIPDFNGRIGGCREQVSSIRMERNFVHHIISCIVVLDRLVHPDVEDFDDLVGATGGNTGSIWVELDRLDSLVVIMEGMNQSL